jgi:hypothetical protein
LGEILPFPETSSLSAGCGPVEAGRTVRWKAVEEVVLPSLTYTITSEQPVCPETGVSVTVRLLLLPLKSMLVLGRRLALVDVAQSVRVSAAACASLMVKGMVGAKQFWVTVTLGMAEMVGGTTGGGLCATTVNAKAVLAVATPSPTVIVMSDSPLCPDAGVIVTVRLLSLPPNTMLLAGTRSVWEEVAERVRFDAAVTGSPMTKKIGAVGVS